MLLLTVHDSHFSVLLLSNVFLFHFIIPSPVAASLSTNWR